jgi:hypothetical protein
LRHLPCKFLVATTPLVRQSLPMRQLCLGSGAGEVHVHRDEGVLASDQCTGVSLNDMKLTVAEIILLEPPDFMNPLR